MIVTYKLGLEFYAILSLRTIDHWAGSQEFEQQ